MRARTEESFIVVAGNSDGGGVDVEEELHTTPHMRGIHATRGLPVAVSPPPNLEFVEYESGSTQAREL